MDRVQIKFFTRPGCKLCVESLRVLKMFEDRFELQIEKVNIDTSPELLRTYGHHIPVATMGGKELFRHRAEAREIEKILESRLRGVSHGDD
jgi:hypothetical protein